MKKKNPLFRKNLFRLFLLICIGIIPISLSAQTTEHFTNGEVIGANTFSEGGFSFNMTGGRFATFEGLTYGWTGTAKDDRYVDNYGNYPGTAGVLGSFVIVAGTFKASELYVFPGETGDQLASTGNIIIRGKLGGATQFTYTIASGSINMSGFVNNGWTRADLSAYNTYSLDQIEFEVTGALRYLAIDAFKFTGTAANNAPTDVTLSASAINENVATNSTVGTLSSTDPNAGNTFTYSLVSGTGSTDNASFNISGSNLQITNSPDYETKNSYSVRIRTTDQGGLYYEKAFTISINNVNEAPSDIALSASAIDENATANSTVGSLSSTDPDVGNTFTYTLVAGTGSTDNASFNISGSSLRITNSPDFETKNSYSVRVRTTDQGSLTYEKVFTITINNVNEAPSDVAISASAINENVVANSTVGTLSSTDVDAANTFTYTLVAGTGSTDNASFNISGSSLRINNSPDFETKSSYTVRVRTTDQGSLIFEKAFTVTINDINEAPTDIALSASVISENVIANTTIGTLSTTDIDAANTFTYTLVAGTGSTDNASFNISGSSLRITNSPDFETKSSYSVRVRTTDQGTLTYEKVFTITINNVNEAPSDIVLSASAINENVAPNSTVGTLSSTDVDAANTFTYTLVAGTGSTDNASFNISGSSLRMTSSPNFETKNSYSVRVRTTDQGSLTYEKAFTITINNVNETPTDIALSASAIDENVPANSTIGTLSSTDVDAANTFTYTLVAGTGSTDNASFNISGSSLRITASPDFETKNSYSVRVRTTDQGTLFFEKAFTISINDINENVAATLTTQAVTGITWSTAIGNGNITSLGVPNPTQYGVVWSTSTAPTVALATKTTEGTATSTGGFSSNIIGLDANTTYYLRAYATNLAGTAYGNEVSFKSAIHEPSVTTMSSSNVTANSATFNANVIAYDASTTVTFEYGLDTNYGTTVTAAQSPVTGSSVVAVSKTITGLALNTVYHVRAVATNGGGTSYGVDVAFVTPTTAPDAPTGVTATADLDKVIVSFTPPTNNGGLAILSYTVTSTPDNIITVGYSGSPITVTGLTNGKNYTFTVKADNASGTSVPSVASNSVAPYHATSSYTGTGNWSDAANWDSGIPGSGTTVTIFGNVTLANNTTVKAITTNAGSSLTVNAGKTLTVTNGIYNNGTITNDGTIVGAIVVSIVFEENGGSLVSDLTQDYNTALTLPTPTKNGYDFIGWCSDIALNTLFNATNMPINGVTLYAKWQLATGIDSNAEVSISIYPNPATDEITISVGNQPTQVSIYDLGGALLISQLITGTDKIDISNLPQGTYALKANEKVIKFVKR